MDANHCPGAVMFLFEVGSRRILHVGDFRWNRDVMMQFAPIRELSAQRQRLDELFLDTTYCDEKYSLPTQEDAIRATVEVAEREFNIAQQGGKRALLLFGAYTIGKERIYFSVAQRLKLKIYVDTQRYKILSSLNWTEEQMSLLTTVKSETCLWVVPLGHINMKQLSSYLGNGKSSNQFEKIVGFRPTGWSLSMRFNGIVSSRSNGNLTIHSVPYSEHSSFPELVDCVQCLNPKKIVPTVSVSKSQQQLDLIARALKQKQAKLC
jgi:DNA cross-link repair 1A protein